jgi:PAS domain S-box-containing protein
VTLSVFQKGLVLAAVPFLFQFGFVLLVVRVQSAHSAAEALTAHTKEVIAQTQAIHTLISSAGAGVADAVVARDPALAAPFTSARRELPGQFDVLDRLVSDNPEQMRRARSVRAAAEAVLDWDAGLEQLVREGGADRAAQRVRSGRGEALRERFRQEIGPFLAEEERLDRVRVSALAGSRAGLNLLFVIGGLAALGCTTVVALAFRRGIGRRFAALEDTAQRLATGESPGAPLGGGDEIARLDRAFRTMAADLTRASDELRDLYDHAPCGYHSVDPDGTVVAVNRTELRWLGYRARELIGRVRFVDLVAPGSRDTYRAAFARVKEHGGVTDVELELVRKDGSTFPVLVNSSAVRGPDGRYLRSRTTLTDLTERKRAEDAVRRLNAELEQRVSARTAEAATAAEGKRASEERFRLFAEGVRDYAIVALDLRGRVVSWNAGAERITGYTAEEVAGRPFAQFYPEGDDDPGASGKWRTVSWPAARFEEEGWRVRKDGSRFWANCIITPIADPHGRPLGFSAITRDLTERRRTEEEVRRRAAELEALNRELAQKNTENEMFVYSVSHDLRSPLVNLQGFSRELDKACRGLAELFALDTVPTDVRLRGQTILDGKVAKSVGFIQTAVTRLSNIIDALLRLSRAGRVDYRWETVDVSQVVTQVVRAAQVTITERGATVTVGDLPPAWGDRTAIEQVFGNLVGNALTYLDPARPGLIEIGALEPADGGRTYFVRDNGLGIAEGHRQKIFQAFQRAHPGVGSGEGLGLAIVARVVERHHGRVWVESTPGAGSTFFITLPPRPTGAN